jgi:hypothetical protein
LHFCGYCGTRLSNGVSLPDASATNLGLMMGAVLNKRFREASLQAGGYLRNVTVLFVDLTDYTRLSEKMDSEDLYEIIIFLILYGWGFGNIYSCGKLGRGASSKTSECKASPRAFWCQGCFVVCQHENLKKQFIFLNLEVNNV